MPKKPNSGDSDHNRLHFEEQVLSRLAASSQRAVKVALANFERLMSPGKLQTITTKTIDEFVALRLKDRGKNPKSPISPATVNKDLHPYRVHVRRRRHVAWRSPT